MSKREKSVKILMTLTSFSRLHWPSETLILIEKKAFAHTISLFNG